MSFPSPFGRVSFLGTALFLAASIVSAQSIATQAPAASDSFSPATESSSLQSLAALDADASAMPSAPAPSASPAAGGPGAAGHGAAAGQDYGGAGGWKHYVGSRFALEAGGGFNAPESPSVTYGGNFNLGGGLNFNKYFGALIEYQFLQDKLPGSLIGEAEAQGGYARIWSFTLAPVINLMPKSRNGVYITGGYGFYRKVTSFTDPETVCVIDFFEECGTENTVVGHFSSNQGGFNFGGGFEHRLGGMYGDSKAKLFAEARYLDVQSPAVAGESPTGSGTITTIPADTKLIPVTVGVRF